MNDKRNCHGAVDKSSLEQHFCKSATRHYLYHVKFSGALYLVQLGLTAGRQAGTQAGRRNTG